MRKFLSYEESPKTHVTLSMLRDFAILPDFLWIYDPHYFNVANMFSWSALDRIPMWKSALRLMVKTGKEYAWNQLYEVYDAYSYVGSDLMPYVPTRHFPGPKVKKTLSGLFLNVDIPCDEYTILVEDEKEATLRAAIQGIQVFNCGTSRLTKETLSRAREL